MIVLRDYCILLNNMKHKQEKNNIQAIIIGVACILILGIVGLFVFYNDEQPEVDTDQVNVGLEEALGIFPIQIQQVPLQVEASSTMEVVWNIDTEPTIINHTAIHWDDESHPGEFGFDVTPADAGYAHLTSEFAAGEFNVPRQFISRIFVPGDVENIFFRAHAIIDGRHYWTTEQRVLVMPQATTTPETDGEGQSQEDGDITGEDEMDGLAVVYTDAGFEPTELVISRGETVTFANESNRSFWPASDDHPTHTAYPGTALADCGSAASGEMFDACSPVIAGSNFSFTFYQPGEWGYHDHLRPSYSGKITVQ